MPKPLFAGYRCPPHHFDEAFDAEGRPRAAWAALVAALEAGGAETLERQSEALRRMVELDGVTYNVYADPKGADRPWALDPIPMVIGAADWQTISQGIAQRADLLDRTLADIYGPQDLIREGLLPPALAFGHPGYLWPCQGISPAGGRWMHVYAADLARSEDGRWWVIHDRTQGPSGVGYASQNRRLVARSQFDVFRHAQVAPLADFLRALRDALGSMAPVAQGETPRIVLLTPGPWNETYFEHSLLARHLGFALVEGQDLTVRQDRVFMKTLQGLQPVHAILRRLDDDYCDPAELRTDSALGVPGLLAAVRAGNVLVANGIGSGVLETTGIHGFLPGICERLLGAPLRLPSVATWWCGEAPALEHVLEHLDELVIKPAFPGMSPAPVFGHRLDAAGRAALAERLRATPHAFLAQEWVRLSQAPSLLANGRIGPRSVGLRVFAVATPEGWRVMPGGLARVAQDFDDDIVTMQHGGASKDIWVQSPSPVSREALAHPPITPPELVRAGAIVPSRIAENLFWLGRYAERCEAQVRLLRAALNRLGDADEEAQRALLSLAAVARSQLLLDEKDESTGLPEDAVWLAAVLDPKAPNSLLANARRLQRAGSQIRERLSADNWHALNRLPQVLEGAPKGLAGVAETLDHAMLLCVSFAGFAMDDMTRDDGWRFLLLGRRIERLSGLGGLLGDFLGGDSPRHAESLEWLLEACDSIITYRSRYPRAPELLPVLDLLVFDRDNPHALGFQLDVLARYMSRLGRDFGVAFEHDPAPLLDTLRRFDPTRFHNLALLGEAAPGQAPVEALGAFATRAQRFGWNLSDELSLRFFSHADRAVQTAEAA
ncbi:circularly permuted type 2 ATP-grasp protein [Niveibacterium umoris]|uniref:Putative circularly permuted ATP-grasp superfamily protein/putative alpha-E superfamily protein n=1 Tax=Niveibacterium umoris TaxID=1193620 RepID=A0A840BKW2_9RHOO|nr:circularly permuted type 2 ATP-grasp protein [Niveibacterium umoris]MBB4012262.1 putative circularly permuted ATP-grasp superfamily protein/putative alpha-E superfamily protein [Niveibacterium umoris]